MQRQHNELMTALQKVVEDGNVKALRRMLKSGVISVNAVIDEKLGSTLLSIAAIKGDIGIVKELLKHKDLKIDQADKKGNTSLGWAIAKDKPAIAKLLIENGADCFIRDPGTEYKQSLDEIIEEYAKIAAPWETVQAAMEKTLILPLQDCGRYAFKLQTLCSYIFQNPVEVSIQRKKGGEKNELWIDLNYQYSMSDFTFSLVSPVENGHGITFLVAHDPNKRRFSAPVLASLLIGLFRNEDLLKIHQDHRPSLASLLQLDDLIEKYRKSTGLFNADAKIKASFLLTLRTMLLDRVNIGIPLTELIDKTQEKMESTKQATLLKDTTILTMLHKLSMPNVTEQLQRLSKDPLSLVSSLPTELRAETIKYLFAKR